MKRHVAATFGTVLLTTVFAATTAAATCSRMSDEGRTGWPRLTEARIQGPLTSPEFAPFRAVLLEVANKAFDFFRDRNFPSPSLCVMAPIKVDIHSNNLGSYRSDFGQLAVGLAGSGFTQDFFTPDGFEDFTDTVAHEIFHAVQYAKAPLAFDDPDLLWVVEGTAVAAGVGFARAQGYPHPTGLYGWGRPVYDTPLHQPYFEQAEAATRRSFEVTGNPALIDGVALGSELSAIELTHYQRGHFFYNMGRDLGSDDGAKWLATAYTAAVQDGRSGLKWLDDLLREQGQGGIAGYYPRFIARHAGTLEDYRPEARAAAPWSVDLVPGQIQWRSGSVLALAAVPLAVDLGIPEPGDTLYLVEQYLPMSTQGWARMVVDDQVVPLGESYRRLVSGDRERWLTRIVNVDRARPWASGGQSFELGLTAEPVMFDQGCLAPGQTFTPALPVRAAAGIEAALKADQMRWRIPGGKVLAPMTLQAPRSGLGPIEISLLERHKDGWKSHVVGTAVLAAGGCQVRMTAGPGIMTYDPQDDYTEIREQGRADAVYLGSEGRIAIFENGAWMDLPPEMRGMVGAALSSGFLPKGGGAALARGDFEAGAHRIPQELWREFSWPALREATFGGRSIERKAARCPDGRGGCAETRLNPVPGSIPGVAAQGITVTILFDANGMPLEVDFGTGSPDGTLRFEVGRFEMGRPPGW